MRCSADHSSDGGPLLRWRSSSVDARAVLDRNDGHVRIDLVDDPVRATSCAVQPFKVGAQGPADALAIARPGTVGGLDGRRGHLLGQSLPSSLGRWRPPRPRTAPPSGAQPRKNVFPAEDLGLASRELGKAVSDLGDKPWSAHDLQRLLQRLEVSGADDHRRRLAVTSDHDPLAVDVTEAALTCPRRRQERGRQARRSAARGA